MGTATNWDDAALARLRGLAASGMSAAQMAEAIGGVTRNAVIGACHRNGIPFGPKRSEKPERPPVQPKPRAPKPPKAPAAPRQRRAPGIDGGLAFRMGVAAEWARNAPPLRNHEDDAAIPVEQRKTSMDLGAAGSDCLCHWPVGEPGTPEFFFCAAPAEFGAVYCVPHMKRATTKAAPSPRAISDQQRGFLRARQIQRNAAAVR